MGKRTYVKAIRTGRGEETEDWATDSRLSG